MSQTKERVELILNLSLVVAALAIAAVAVDRQFFKNGAASASSVDPGGPPEYVDDWRSWLDNGVLMGRDDAPVKIVEFADLQCSFCRTFHDAARRLSTEHGDSMALVFVHYPLQMHRFARPAAVAAECAGQEEHRFGAFVDAVYAQQDSLGLKTWSSYARDAGIRDTLSFARCISAHQTFPRIEKGLSLGKAIGVRGTPTVLINGWRLSTPPYDSLAKVVEDVITGQEPFAKR